MSFYLQVLLGSLTLIECRHRAHSLQGITVDSGEESGEDYDELAPKDDAFPSASNSRVKIQVQPHPQSTLILFKRSNMSELLGENFPAFRKKP